MLTRSLAGTLAAYALIWGIFLAAPVSRGIVLHQLRRWRPDLAPAFLIGAAVGGALVLLNVTALLVLGTRTLSGWAAPTIGGLCLTLVYTGIVATTEELIVRGVMLTRLRQWVNTVPAIGVTALVFALMHAGRRDFSPASVGQYAVDGVLLGWAAVRTESIWFGVGWHWAKNFGVALAFGLSRGIMAPVVRLEDVVGRTDRAGDVVAYALAVPLAVLAVVVLARRKVPSLAHVTSP